MGLLLTGSLPSLTRIPYNRGKTQNILGSLSQDVFGYRRNPANTC